MATLVLFGHDLSGTTAQRPTNVEIGQPYFDTTLGLPITWNGTIWVADVGGAPGSLTVTVGPATITPTQTVASAAGATLEAVRFSATTITVSGATGITTAGGFNFAEIEQPIYSAASALTITNAATLKIDGAPTGAGAGPATITNAYAIWVAAGISRFDGLIYESAAVGITAGTTRTQGGATVLTKEVNRVDTSTAPAAGSTLGDGVLLPASAAGLDITVINNTANPIQVYGTGADTINGQTNTVGVPIPPNSVEMFECAVAGTWYYDAGVGFAGPLNTVLACDNISAAGATQGTATQLVADLNRIVTATANQGVMLPASKPGMDIIIENHTGVPITVYGAGTDTINDIPTASGLSQMDSSVVIFTCYASGKWYANGAATGYARNPQNNVTLETMQFSDSLTATGANQAGALQMTGAVNTVATVAAGTGVNLVASAPGLVVTVINAGANPLLVYPAQGATDTINGVAAATGVSLFPGTAAVFNCTATGAWTTQPGTTNNASFNTDSGTGSHTLTAANITGGAVDVYLAMTGILAGAANATLPTVTAMVALLHSPTVGTSFMLRIINRSTAAFSWTVVTNTGWTLAGTMSIAQNTWRDFQVKLTSLTTATFQAVGTGTDS